MDTRKLTILIAGLVVLLPHRGLAGGLPPDMLLLSHMLRQGYDGQVTMREFDGLSYANKVLLLQSMQEGWDTGVMILASFGYEAGEARARFQERAYLLRGWKMTPMSFRIEALAKIDRKEARFWRCALILAEARFAKNAGQTDRAHALVAAAKTIDKAAEVEENKVACITSRKESAAYRKEGKTGLMTRGFLDGIRLALASAETGIPPSMGYSWASVIESMAGLYGRGGVKPDSSVLQARLLAVSELVAKSTVE